MTDQIRLKRTTGSGPPATLAFGEPAYSDGDQQLHIGTANGDIISLPAAAAPLLHNHPELATATHAHDYAATNHNHPELATATHAHDYAATNHNHPELATATHAHDYAATNHGHPDLAAADHAHDYAPLLHAHPDLATADHTHPELAQVAHTHPDLATGDHAHPAPGWQFSPLTLAANWQNYPSTVAQLASSTNGTPLASLSAVLQATTPTAALGQLPTDLAPAFYQVFPVNWLGPPGSGRMGAGAITIEPSGQIGWLRYWGNDIDGIDWLAFTVFWIPQI